MALCARLPSSAHTLSTASKLAPRMHLFKQHGEIQQRVKSGSQALLEEVRGIYILQKTIVGINNLEQYLVQTQCGRTLHSVNVSQRFAT